MRARRRYGRARRLSLAGAVVLAGAVCAPVGAGAEPGPTGTLRFLAATTGAETARVAMSFGPDSDGELLSSGTGAGIVDFATGEAELISDTHLERVLPDGAVDAPPPPVDVHSESRAVGGGYWFREWLAGAEPGPWVDASFDIEDLPDDIPLDELPDEPEVFEPTLVDALNDPTVLDPKGFMRLVVRGARSLSEVGPGDIDGTPTTHYRADIDDESLGEDAGYLDADHLDVWIDQQRRLRRVVVGTYTLDVFDYGVDFDVEAPTDAVSWEDAPPLGLEPSVTDEWTLESEGETGGEPWQVYAAPATVSGAPSSCRTLETESSDPGVPDWWDDWMAEAAAYAGEDPTGPDGAAADPVHEGFPATCGSGTMDILAIPDPALQVLPPSLLGAFDDGPLLAGIRVAPQWATSDARLVLSGGQTVDVPLDDAGIAVWDVRGSGAIEQIELADGAVVCPARISFDDLGGFPELPDGAVVDDPTAMVQSPPPVPEGLDLGEFEGLITLLVGFEPCQAA